MRRLQLVHDDAWPRAEMKTPEAQRRADDARVAVTPPEAIRAGVRHGERDAPVVDGGGCSAFLYDAGGEDRDVALDKALIDGLADNDLLWVDVDSSQAGAVALVSASCRSPRTWHSRSRRCSSAPWGATGW